MKINCLSCGHNIDLDDAYGDHYEGQVKCFGCEARLEIHTEHGAIRYVHLLNMPPQEALTDGEVHKHKGHAGKMRQNRVRDGAERTEPLGAGNRGHEASANDRAA